jgi:heme/copper-type cytochrome/quinol oxidase subunit 2
LRFTIFPAKTGKKNTFIAYLAALVRQTDTTKFNAMTTLLKNSSLAKALKIIFYSILGLKIISIYSNYMQYRLLSNALNGIAISADDAHSNTIRQVTLSVLLTLALLASMVVFIIWFYRAYKNLHLLGVRTLNHTAGWAIGAWFVPFLNLGRPYVIMREIWDESQEQVNGDNSELNVSSALVGWWWAFWLTNNLIANITLRFISTDTVPGLMNSTMALIISGIVGVVAVTVTLIMLTRAHEFEKELAEHVKNRPEPEPVRMPV